MVKRMSLINNDMSLSSTDTAAVGLVHAGRARPHPPGGRRSPARITMLTTPTNFSLRQELGRLFGIAFIAVAALTFVGSIAAVCLVVSMQSLFWFMGVR